MTFKFDKEKLHEILKNFYTISKITMSGWDADFNQLTFYPNPMSPICEKIKSCPSGKRKFLDSDISACVKAATQKNTYTFTCHIGLVDTVVPIYYGDDIIAYIMFGQIRDEERKLSDINTVKCLCKKYGIDEKHVEEYYNQLPVFNREQIDALSNLFKACIPYFYSSHAITIEQNETANKISRYIAQNLTSPLTVEQLCKEIGISVNTLYQISHRFFNTSIKNYIIDCRIDQAKHYLTTTNWTISEISVKVGCNDYNYFIRTFK